MKETTQDKITAELTHELGKRFEARAKKYDDQGEFARENYADLKQFGYFSAMIPMELGGQGISHSEFCAYVRIIGQYCASTALALSMHSHLIAATVWKYKKGQGGEDLLRKVAEKHLVLISTGARDWLESNGDTIKVKDGYLVSGMKFFASQSAVGDVAVTSAPYYDPSRGWVVLHFGVPMGSKGVTVLNDWDTMGMRATGSNTISFDNVFVPEEAVTLVRGQGEFHPFWNVVLTVAMPLIMSSYVGAAQRAFRMALERVQKLTNKKDYLTYQVGEMYNQLVAAEVQLEDMIRIANDLDFGPTDNNSMAILTRKTNVANAVIAVVSKAFDTVGGSAFYKKNVLERIFRDVQAARYHPLNEKEQQAFVGDRLVKVQNLKKLTHKRNGKQVKLKH